MRVASHVKLLRRAADGDRDWFEREPFGPRRRACVDWNHTI